MEQFRRHQEKRQRTEVEGSRVEKDLKRLGALVIPQVRPFARISQFRTQNGLAPFMA